VAIVVDDGFRVELVGPHDESRGPEGAQTDDRADHPVGRDLDLREAPDGLDQEPRPASREATADGEFSRGGAAGNCEEGATGDFYFVGHTVPWSSLVTGASPLYTNFCRRRPWYVSVVKMLPFESTAML